VSAGLGAWAGLIEVQRFRQRIDPDAIRGLANQPNQTIKLLLWGDSGHLHSLAPESKYHDI
jgi:hypothetical protein